MEAFARKFDLDPAYVAEYYNPAEAAYYIEEDSILAESSLDVFTYMKDDLNTIRKELLRDTDNLRYCYLLRTALYEEDTKAINALCSPNASQKNTLYDTLPLFSLLSLLPGMRYNHDCFKIPQDVTEATCGMFENQMQDFIDLNHRYGISTYVGWMNRFVKFRMIRVGRFNLEISEYNDPYDFVLENGILTPVTPGSAPDPILTQGDPIVSVHIPSGGPLIPEVCDRDLARGEEIITRCFGDFKAFYCQSWLLNPELESILGRKTNITRFGDSFTKLPLESGGNDVFEYVFRLPSDTPLEDLPAKNSLSAAIKAHLLNGGKIKNFAGIFLPRRTSSCS